MTDPNILVLASLAKGDKHGYAMIDDIERFADIRLGAGTLYGAITRLEERGWIARVKSGDERRQPYRITPMGQEHLAETLASVNRVVKTGLSRLKCQMLDGGN